MVVEEPQAVLVALEGATRHPTLAQIKQVGPDLFLVELVR
jgi:hypothetical protein